MTPHHVSRGGRIGWPVLGLLLAVVLWAHIALSLQRIGAALLLALLIGVPLGIWVGLSPLFARLTGTLDLLARRISARWLR